MGYGLTWGVYAAELHADVFPNVPIGTLNLVAGLANFVMGGSALVAGRLAEKLYVPLPHATPDRPRWRS
jgi:hypothetical protein